MRSVTICSICHSIKLEEIFILQGSWDAAGFEELSQNYEMRHVCLSVRPHKNNLAPTRRIFIKFGI